MAPSPSDNDFLPIGKLCLELCKESVAIGHVVKLSLKIGSSFSFNYCSDKNGNPLPAALGPKKKSKATIERDRQRRAAFLLKKKAASSKISAPVAPESSLLESPEVTTSHVDTVLPSLETVLPSSSFVEHRPSGTDHNDSDDESDLSATPLASKDINSSLCICNSLPCTCLASTPLSPIKDQPVVPSVKLKMTAAGWRSTTCSSQPLCDNCGEPFLDSKHLCVEDDENDSQTSKQESSQSFEQDILDYNACCDVVTKDFYSLQDKVQILQQNCISLLKNEPIDFKLAKYCFSRSKFFQLRESNQTLGLSMQKVVNIFDKEFEEQYKKYYDE